MQGAFGHIANPHSERWIPGYPSLNHAKHSSKPRQTQQKAAWFVPASNLLVAVATRFCEPVKWEGNGLIGEL